jgi:hypothetical protein
MLGQWYSTYIASYSILITNPLKCPGIVGEYAESIRVYMENALEVSKHIQRIRRKNLNLFGEYSERIYANMEKTHRDSWRILLIHRPRDTKLIISRFIMV